MSFLQFIEQKGNEYDRQHATEVVRESPLSTTDKTCCLLLTALADWDEPRNPMKLDSLRKYLKDRVPAESMPTVELLFREYRAKN